MAEDNRRPKRDRGDSQVSICDRRRGICGRDFRAIRRRGFPQDQADLKVRLYDVEPQVEADL
jgi:hypothetical protein